MPAGTGCEAGRRFQRSNQAESNVSGMTMEQKGIFTIGTAGGPKEHEMTVVLVLIGPLPPTTIHSSADHSDPETADNASTGSV